MTQTPRRIFVTGGTGFIGSRAVAALLARGHSVRALARRGSERRLPPGAEVALGDALDANTFVAAIPPCDTFLQLVGTPRPTPSKAAEFAAIDLVSVRESVRAATNAGVAHFIYLSVAHPAPVMRAYQDVRLQGEALIRETGLGATMLRPWYVLGPGHWWPLTLLPLYALASLVPRSRATAQRTGLVAIGSMVRAIIAAVEAPPPYGSVRAMDVAAIRAAKNTPCVAQAT
ncbi:MAG: SDR family oxidoreductase [Gemmatimonadaceae bacterium]